MKAAEAAKTAAVEAPAPAKPEAEAEPAKTEPTPAEPAKTEPTTAEPAKAEPAKDEPTGKPAGHYGGEFTLTEITPLSDVLANVAANAGKNVKVAARISKVCRKKGCWFVLQNEKDPSQTVRIKMKDYGFFVPTNCDGQEAVVEGVFNKVDVPVAAAKHLAEDGGQDPDKVKTGTVELRMVATAIDIKALP